MRTKGGQGGRNFCQMKRCDIDKQKLKLKKRKRVGQVRDEWGQRHARSANPGSGRSAVQTSVSCASIEMQIPLFQLIMEAVRSVCGCVCVCEGGRGRKSV